MGTLKRCFRYFWADKISLSVSLFVGVALFLLIRLSHAEGVEDVVAVQDFLQMLFSSLGGIPGASALGIAAIVTQLLMKLFQTPLMEMAGKWRLVAVCVFSLASGVIAMVSQGVPLAAALIHGTTLASFQVLAHQVYKQLIVKKNEAKAALPPAAPVA